jgi:hypothetical protein
MCALRDSIFNCPQCGAENFFDLEALRQKKALQPCWGCGGVLANPPRMRFGAAYGAQLVMLSPGAQLFAHHLEGDTYNFDRPLAEVIAQPLGLKNLSSVKWTSHQANGSMAEVNPGQALPLYADCRIRFGKVDAEVRIN